MYLYSHISTSIDISFFSVKKELTFSSEDYHFIMVLNGIINVEEAAGKFTLKPNDFILFHPNMEYKIIFLSENFLLDISIEHRFIDASIDAGHRILCNSTLSNKKDHTELQGILTDLTASYHSDNNSFYMYALIYRLINCICEHYLISIVDITGNEIQQRHAQRVLEIVNYINRNYLFPLTLQTLADHMYLTPQYLSKIIKQHLGTTFYKYLIKTRLEHAMVELTRTDHSITTIAFNNGFPNLTAFNKAFKEFYDTTPTIYRQKEIMQDLNKNKKDVNTITAESYHSAKDYLLTVERSASDRYATTPLETQHAIYGDVTQMTPLNTIWLEVINLGLAQNILSQSFQEIFRESQRILQFKYARFQNMFDEEFFYEIPDKNTFNFTNIDVIFDFFEDCKIHPFIELSNKPRKIGINTNKSGIVRYDQVEEKPISYYLNALNAIIKHCINRYGIVSVSQWKFEIWAKHDVALSYTETPRAYVKRFKDFSSIIKRYLPNALIGGPGFNTSSRPEIFKSFLMEFDKSKLFPDFISLYLYSYETSRHGNKLGESDAFFSAILSPDPQKFKHTLIEYKKLITELLQVPLPIYVTEFNSDITTNNFINHSCFQAAFICKNNIDLLDQVKSMGYWLFAGGSEEYHVYKSQNIAGIGLVDLHGIKKPSYFAYDFLVRLGNKLISVGDQHIITASSNDTYQILAYNYAHFNKLYCINYYEQIDIKNTYDIFEEKPTALMNIELTHLQKGWYKICKYVLNRENGSTLDKYLHILENGDTTPSELMYMILNLQANEAEYYKNSCIPKQVISYTHCEDRLSLSLQLDPHEINFIEITRRI